MKRKVYSLLLIFCIIFSSGFVLTSCGKKHNKAEDWSSDNINHWKVCLDEGCDKILDLAEHDFVETRVEATIDTEGKITKTCSVCSKVIEEVIPIVEQTKADMVDVLMGALSSENYKDYVQENYTKRTNTEDGYSALQSFISYKESIVKKQDGVTAYFEKDGQTNKTTSGRLIEKVGSNFVDYAFTSSGSDNYEAGDNTIVGNNYSTNYVVERIKSNMGYLLSSTDEEKMLSSLKDKLKESAESYKTLFAGFGDVFTYNDNDLRASFDIVYVEGVYTLTGSVSLTRFTRTGENPTKSLKALKLDTKVIYTKNYVSQNYSKLTVVVDETPSVANDSFVTLYTEHTYKYQTAVADIIDIVEARNVVQSLSYGNTGVRKENVRIYIDGIETTYRQVNCKAKINTKVDEFVSYYSQVKQIDRSRIKVYLDRDYTIEYKSAEDVIVDDYYGTDVYIVILPQS